ncbi:MAG: chromate transporter, partial [Clostridia bacterium]|nr:chromate transporter [Clostridia bacterium]
MRESHFYLFRYFMQNKSLFKTLCKLFLYSFYIGASSFGGGFVSLSLIKSTYNQKLKWITDGEMLDFSALA